MDRLCPGLERRTTRLEHARSKLEHFGYHDGVFRRVCRECGFIGFLGQPILWKIGWRVKVTTGRLPSRSTQRGRVLRKGLLQNGVLGLSLEVLNTSHQRGTLGAWGRSNGTGFFDWRLSYNHKFNERLAVSLSRGVLQSRKGTWGLAVCMNAGPLAIFVATDHIGIAQGSRIVVDQNTGGVGVDQDAFVVPNQAHTMQIQAGLTWRFGWRNEKKTRSNSMARLDDSSFIGSSRSPNAGHEGHPGAVPMQCPWKLERLKPGLYSH